MTIPPRMKPSKKIVVENVDVTYDAISTLRLRTCIVVAVMISVAASAVPRIDAHVRNVTPAIDSTCAANLSLIASIFGGCAKTRRIRSRPFLHAKIAAPKMATLFIDAPTKTKHEILKLIASKDECEIATGIEQAIVQQTDAVSYVDVTHCVVRAVSLSKKSKILKKLFFYFIETFPKLDSDGNLVSEALVFCNFLRQQIEHPNEFVRGRAIALLSKLDSVEMVDLLYKPLKDNLYHSHSYVRRCAYVALGSIYARYRFDEVPGLLGECFSSEVDALNLKQLFATLFPLAPDIAKKWLRHCDVVEMPAELLSEVLLSFKDDDFAAQCLAHSDKHVKFQAAANLIENCADGVDSDVGIKEHVEIVVGIIKEDEFRALRHPALELFTKLLQKNKFGFKNCSLEMLALCDSSDCALSRAIFDFVLEISEPHEFSQVADVVVALFKKTVALNDQKKRYKVALLEMMAKLVQIYGMYDVGMVDAVTQHLRDSDPELQFASFQFVHAISKLSKTHALGLVLETLKSIKFGRIFRYALNILKESTRPGDVGRLMAEFDSLADDATLPYKIESSNVTFIAIVLTEILVAHKGALEKGVIDTGVGLLVKLSTHDIDLCSKSTINACVRTLIAGKFARVESGESLISGDDVLAPLSFPLLPTKKRSDALERRTRNEKVEVVQLTSLSDPLYCEANVKVHSDTLLVDVLCINNTGFDLHGIAFDFVFSGNLALKTQLAPFSIAANAIKEAKFVFRISEAMNGFVLGRVSFSFPDEKKKFSATEMSVNLGEIRLSVLDFLRPQKIDPEQFRRRWLKSEWENLYSLKFAVDEHLLGISKIVVQRLSGFLVNEEIGDDFYLANMSCATEHGADVLVNFCIRKADVVHFEARIRSSNEDLVKSLSAAIGETLRGLKE